MESCGFAAKYRMKSRKKRPLGKSEEKGKTVSAFSFLFLDWELMDCIHSLKVLKACNQNNKEIQNRKKNKGGTTKQFKETLTSRNSENVYQIRVI